MSRKFARRGFLAAAGAVGLAAFTPLLAACGTPATPTPAPTAAPAPTKAAEAPKPAAPAPTTAPSTAAKPAATTAAAASPAAKPAASTEPVKLKFNTRTGGEQQVFETLMKNFMAKNPNVTITGEHFSGANMEYWQKIAVMVAGATEGDLIWMSSIEGYFDYSSRGTWLALDEYISRDKVELGQWFKSAIDMLKVKNKLYALPQWSHSSMTGLYYNKDMFQKEGIPLPDDTWTTDTLTEAAIKLTKRSGSTIQQLGYTNSCRFFLGLGEAIRSYGGESLSADGTKMTFDTPQARQAIQWLSDLFNKHKVAPIPGQSNIGDLLLNQKLGSYSSGYWQRFAAETTWKFKWDLARMPKGPAGDNGPMLQTDSCPISKRTKSPGAAWEFHKYLTSQEAGIIQYDLNYIPGSRPDVWNSPKLKADPKCVVWVPLLEAAKPLLYPANFRLREFEDAINQVMTNLWVGKMSTDEAIKEATRVGQQILDKPPA